MNAASIIVLSVVLLAVAVACYFIVKRKPNTDCSSGCGGCNTKNCPSRK